MNKKYNYMNIITIKELDHILDYVPVISTVSNLIDITAKLVLGNLTKDPIDSFPYFAHLSEKSYLRCVTLLIPIVGNIIVGLHDTIDNALIELEDIDFNYSPSNEFEIRENILPLIPTTSTEIFKETTINSNSVENKMDVNPSKSEPEQEIDIEQQNIRNYYEQCKSEKIRESNIATRNAGNSIPFIQPVGINNHLKKNCWCNCVLQILCNTPLYEYVMTKDSKLQECFPKLFEFIKIYREKPESCEELGLRIKEIRVEINKHLGKQFSVLETEEADAMQFIMELLDYLKLDYRIEGFLATENEQINRKISTLKEQCIFINPQMVPRKYLDVEHMFESTPYEPVAVIRAEPAHYSSQVKASNGYWYNCDDRKISKKATVFQSLVLEDDPSTLIVGYRKS